MRGSFTLLVCTTDFTFHGEFKQVPSRMAYALSVIENCDCVMEKKYSVTKNFVMVHVDFVIIRAVAKRLRGTRKKIKSLPI